MLVELFFICSVIVLYQAVAYCAYFIHYRLFFVVISCIARKTNSTWAFFSYGGYRASTIIVMSISNTRAAAHYQLFTLFETPLIMPEYGHGKLDYLLHQNHSNLVWNLDHRTSKSLS